MITRWQISNFKSAYDTTELNLRPITLFAGANSSGKSTFIQSILLIAQTLSSRVFSRPIVLNGHIARLGTFSELASVNSGLDEISVGFTIRVPSEDSINPTLGRARYWYAEDLIEVGCELSFSPIGESPSRELLQLQPKLTRAKLRTVRKGGEQEEPVEFRYSTASIPDRVRELGLDSVSSDQAEGLEYEIISPKAVPVRSTRYWGLETPADAKLIGARLFHFLPNEFTVVFDGTQHGATMAVRYLTQPAFQANFGRPVNPDTIQVTPALLKRVLDIMRPFVETAKRISPARRKAEVDAVLKDTLKAPRQANLWACWGSGSWPSV
jgi:hypothetical protein